MLQKDNLSSTSYQSIQQDIHPSHRAERFPEKLSSGVPEDVGLGQKGPDGKQTRWPLFYGFHRQRGIGHSCVSQETVGVSLVSGYRKGSWMKHKGDEEVQTSNYKISQSPR